MGLSSSPVPPVSVRIRDNQAAAHLIFWMRREHNLSPYTLIRSNPTDRSRTCDPHLSLPRSGSRICGRDGSTIHTDASAELETCHCCCCCCSVPHSMDRSIVRYRSRQAQYRGHPLALRGRPVVAVVFHTLHMHPLKKRRHKRGKSNEQANRPEEVGAGHFGYCTVQSSPCKVDLAGVRSDPEWQLAQRFFRAGRSRLDYGVLLLIIVPVSWRWLSLSLWFSCVRGYM
ncbi:hypothetical protein BP00DRAFT_231429 [Aspergillus indologenus CBS 114.80]|uniref:Uncharacterized protein n=1 Tax=Aspergillus indologenus CBS 114.80 TaxID=1450541 RepID=A0A2V5HYP1_9EURO|nr:hypothetical protein BP00DRAFT_231429 [Aspergillus indologenus CBS 114.80]